MENKLGTSVFCGIDKSFEEICAHLKEAASYGVTTVFTSLQLPEADKDILLRDFPKMTEYAHSLGMIIDTDISKKTAEYYGINHKDLKELKKLGVDVARLDYGYSYEDMAKMTFNEEGLMIEMNATHVTEEKLQELVKYPLNKDNLRFCYNYYPLPLTGQRYSDTVKLNELIHKYGFKVMGFIPSSTRHRVGSSEGLPTIEKQRNQPTSVNIQEGYLCGFDDICFGDDCASTEELQMLAKYKKGWTVFRFKPTVSGEVLDWLTTNEHLPWRYNLDAIVRSWKGCGCPLNVDDIPATERPRGTVTIIKSNGTHNRYKGEVVISKIDLPKDENYATVGYVNEEDFVLLDAVVSSQNNFKLEIE